jgi:asparagine synthase (glutamine-hydrolysing)
MCAIYSILNYEKTENIPNPEYYTAFMKMKHRGPDSSKYEIIDDKVIIGHHRLSINGEGESGDQPIHRNGIYLIANAEIYNWEEIYETVGLNFQRRTKSDCEVILELYIAFGIEYTCKIIRGEWAFMIYDTNKNMFIVARDCIGKRPLYYGYCADSRIGFASEAVSLKSEFNKVIQFPPGHYEEVNLNTLDEKCKAQKWFDYDTMTAKNQVLSRDWKNISRDDILKEIYSRVRKAVHERCTMSDVPVGCYLSGGLDSSLVTALAVEVLGVDMHTYTIGLEGSVDIIAARKVAKHLGIEKNHHVYVATMDEIIATIPEVVSQCGTYCRTTIRCAVYQYLLSKQIKEVKVLLTGEGADEMCPGYFEFHDRFERTDEEFKELSTRRMKEIHQFDGLRSDRSAAAWGLEVRMPLLDELVIEIFQNIPTKYRRFDTNVIEKSLLRDSFAGINLLPDEILYRAKHAFSDAINAADCGKKSYELVEEHAKQLFRIVNTPTNFAESYEEGWYRRLYNKAGYDASMIPSTWLPDIPGVIVSDPSATELPGFKN